MARSKTSGRVFDSLFVRHWDTWSNGTRSNLFVAPVNLDGRAGAPVNLSKALDADVPSKPDGGDEEFIFSPDGLNVVFSARVAGRTEAWSTNFDLYEVSSTGTAVAEKPDRRQSGLGHATGIPAQRRPRVARDEPPRIRSRPLPHQAHARRRGAQRGRAMGSLGSAAVGGARRANAARHRERSRTDAAVRGGRRERRRDPPLRVRGMWATIRPRSAAPSCCGTTSPRLPISIYCPRRANGAGSRVQTPSSSPRARSANSNSSASRAGTTRRCMATW